MRRGRGSRGSRGNGGAGAGSGSNNEGNVRVAGLTPLGQRPVSQLVTSGPLRGFNIALVHQSLAVMPGLAARGPGAVRGAGGPPAAAVPAVAAGVGGGGGVAAAAAAGAAAANAAIGGAAAAAPDRWDPRVPHFELERETVMMDVPMRITEFNELVSISLDGLVRPVINLLYAGEINGGAVRELVEITNSSIRPALQNFVEQLSSRSIAARIAIDTTRHRAYIDRLRTTTQGAQRAEIIRQLQAEYEATIQPLAPAVQQEPTIAQRAWAIFTRSPPPGRRADDSLVFAPPAAAGGAAGPVAPPGVAGAAIPAPAAAGAVAGYIPSERDIRQRQRIVQAKLRRTYEAAARFIQNYRIPNQEAVVRRCPNIMRSLYTNILTALVDYTRILINTITHRLRREGALDRAASTAVAQAALLQRAQENGDDQVEITFQNLRGVEFMSRDQIDNLMDQLILIAVNYMNIDETFRNLLPLISQVYSISTVYVVVADGDQGRGAQGALLGEVFAENLQELIANITREAVVMSDSYVINRDPWFGSDGLVGKIRALGGTLAKLVSPERRVQVQRTIEEGIPRTTVARQTHFQVAREALGILGDMASPVWVAFDRLIELVDPVEFNQTIQLADGSRRAIRGNLRVAAGQAVEIGADMADTVGGVMSGLNSGLVGTLAAVGGAGYAQTIITALAGLDDQSAEMVMNEVRDQGSYQQMRATLMATQSNPNRRELEAMQGATEEMIRTASATEREIVRGWERRRGEGRGQSAAEPMYVSLTGQRVANTQWDRYAVFRHFYSAFTKYSVSRPGTPKYDDFSAYIHSPLIYPHLQRFSLDDLGMMFRNVESLPRNQEWTDKYEEIMRLIGITIDSKEALGNALANQSNNENSYHPNENNNYNSNGNNNGNENQGNQGNQGNRGNQRNLNEYGYAPNAGPFVPEAGAEEAYTNSHDVIAAIQYIVNYGNTFAVIHTPTYIAWETYVDTEEFSQWLDSFTNAQLDNLHREITQSLVYKHNDPLARRILQRVVEERHSSGRRTLAVPYEESAAASAGLGTMFAQPALRDDDRDRDAALAALKNNPDYEAFYNALMWFDEEDYGTARFMAFRRFILDVLPSILYTFTDQEISQATEFIYSSRTTDQRYNELAEILTSAEIGRANGNYGNGMNNQMNGTPRSYHSNNTQGYNNNTGLNAESMRQQGLHAAELSARALGHTGKAPMAKSMSRQGSHAALASAALGYTGNAPMATHWGQSPQLHHVELQLPRAQPTMAAEDGIERSLMRLNTNSNYGNFYDSLLWFDEEDYGTSSFRAFQQYVRNRLPQLITRFTDEQNDEIYDVLIQTGISDDRYDDLAAILGRERGRRGQRASTSRVNFNALSRQNSRGARAARASRSSSRNSNSTFSSLNSAERNHWNMFPNNLEQALSQDPGINPMESYSAAKYKSKMAKSRKAKASKAPAQKAPQKAKSKSNRGNGGGGGARRTSKNNRPARARSHTSKARSNDARILERNIRLALAGDAKGWGASGPEQDAKLHFQYQGGMNEIRQSNSYNLLKGIVAMKPNTNLKRDMITTARERLDELDNYSKNSYNTPNLNSPSP